MVTVVTELPGGSKLRRMGFEKVNDQLSSRQEPDNFVAGTNPRLGTSNREAGIAFENVQLQFRLFVFAPQSGSRTNAIEEGAAVRAVAALEGARDTDKLCFKQLACDMDDGVTVPAHIHEGDVRRRARIGEGARLD